MASFTSDERAFIDDKPLPADVHKIVSELDGGTTREAISNLLAALLTHPVAQRLRSSFRPVNGEIALIYSKLQNDDLDIQSFTPLRTLIASKGSDVDIWQAVLDLISTLSRRTPLQSVPLTYNGTPRTYSSASFRDSEQIRKDLEEPIRQELAGRTYVDVQGFFAKYFENKSWSRTVDQIYDRAIKDTVTTDENIDRLSADLDAGLPTILSEKHCTALCGFPNTAQPEEKEVWKWIDDFQKKYLTNARGIYCRASSQRDIGGAQGRRQVDILLKDRTAPIDGPHNARDFRVIGELTKSSKRVWKEKYLQLATYVRDTFAAQPTRWFVHGFLMFGSQMQLWVFDRSGAYGAEVFDVRKNPQRFLTVIAGYAMMSDSELGVSSVIRSVKSGTVVTVTDTITGKDLELRLESTPIVSQAAIVSRGTVCFRTQDGSKVVKLSWRADKQHSEVDLLEIAQGVRGIPQLVGFRNITTIEELRSDLEIKVKRKLGHEFPERSTDSSSSAFTSQSTHALSKLKANAAKRASVSPDNLSKKLIRSSQQSKLRKVQVPSVECKGFEQSSLQVESSSLDRSSYRNRVLTCLAVSPAGRPLQRFQSILEVLRAFRDTIKAHQSLFLDRNILHRDISINNIILIDPAQNDGCSGMLIDLDLAVLVGEDRKNTTSKEKNMTGTLEYMALQILENAIREETVGIEHTYRHDLESFFYVFLSLCIRCGWPENTRKGIDPLKAWYTGSFGMICSAKRGMMEPGGFEIAVLNEFSPTFQGHKDLARRWRKVLFGEGAVQIETPNKPEILYDPIIKALEDAIREIVW